MLQRLRLPRRASVVIDDTTPVRFPAHFMWGAATADHQVEHSAPDDWTAFEREARAAGHGERVRLGTPKPGHIHGIDSVPLEVMEKKSDFDTHFESDLALAKELGHGAFRFSISWARLFPNEDVTEPDAGALAYYRRVIDAAKRQQLTPFVTLFHFASPAWLWREVNGKRGVERDDAVAHFRRFARVVAEHFGDDVRHWCTLNEPMVVLTNGYREGMFPPCERRMDPMALLPVVRAYLQMHAAAYQELKADAAKRGITNEVGQTAHTRVTLPYGNNLLDRITARVGAKLFMWWFTDCIESGVFWVPGVVRETIPGLKGSQDYVGINYYGRMYVRSRVTRPTDPEILLADPRVQEEQSSLGWAIDAGGFADTLADAWRRYQKPIYVLENGVVDDREDDQLRQAFLSRHIRAMGRVMQERGVDIRGYFHWSLLDNFEWAEGFEPRFGLVAVDYENGFKRTPRKSARLYADIIRNNGM